MYSPAKCEWNFSIYNHKSASEEKIFNRFLTTFFWKCKWLIWDGHKRRNKWTFKNVGKKRKYRHWKKNKNNEADYKKKTRKWLK